jgi:hypothetical protein
MAFRTNGLSLVGYALSPPFALPLASSSGGTHSRPLRTPLLLPNSHYQADRDLRCRLVAHKQGSLGSLISCDPSCAEYRADDRAISDYPAPL